MVFQTPCRSLPHLSIHHKGNTCLSCLLSPTSDVFIWSGGKKKTNWWQIYPGVVIVKPYSMMWQSSTELMILPSEIISKNNAPAAAGTSLTPGWRARFWNGFPSLSRTGRENCSSPLTLSSVQQRNTELVLYQGNYCIINIHGGISCILF